MANLRDTFAFYLTRLGWALKAKKDVFYSRDQRYCVGLNYSFDVMSQPENFTWELRELCPEEDQDDTEFRGIIVDNGATLHSLDAALKYLNLVKDPGGPYAQNS